MREDVSVSRSFFSSWADKMSTQEPANRAIYPLGTAEWVGVSARFPAPGREVWRDGW